LNIQQIIITGIKEQLYHNDYLVLPNFGGFVLKSQSAHYTASGGMLVPPSKTVSFNAQLKQNDGILMVWIQNKLSCSPNEATKHLQEFSEFCTSILTTKRRLNIYGIGFFYLDFEGNICFEPQADANFFRDSFGLTAVSLKPIQESIKEKKKESVFVDRVAVLPPNEVDLPRKKINYNKFISPALLLLIVFSLFGILLSNIKLSGELRSSIFGENSRSEYLPLNYPDLAVKEDSKKAKPYVADANGIAFIELNGCKILPVSTLNRSVENTSVESSKKFEVVLGCFSVMSNAKKMTSKLNKEKVKAKVSKRKHKGMYVVYSGRFDTKAAAIAHLSDIKSSYPNAWIKGLD
jgi:nucleoid DNA-binding protein